MNSDGQRLPPGEVGVLGFRAPEGRGPQFHADPEKTKSAYIAPGVFTLGDVGYVDEEGYVYVTDRIADMVVSGGNTGIANGAKRSPTIIPTGQTYLRQ